MVGAEVAFSTSRFIQTAFLLPGRPPPGTRRSRRSGVDPTIDRKAVERYVEV
jgi:hypothetical protein